MMIADVDRLFTSLPEELQRCVARYLHVWERQGLKRPPAIETRCPRVDHCRYYRTIRQCPRGAKWSREWPTHLHYRRQRDTFLWELRVQPSAQPLDLRRDVWCIEMRPQWQPVRRSIVQSIFRHDLWNVLDIDLDPVAVELQQMWMPGGPPHSVVDRCDNAMVMHIEIVRESATALPTRQMCAQALITYIRQLNQLVQSTYIRLVRDRYRIVAV